MGYGDYSHEAHKALLHRRAKVSDEQVFQQRRIHPLMDPKGVRARESRDSKDHPHSLGVVFGLDVTGSMGDIPRLLAKEQLPSFMQVLMDCGVEDPQLLFMAIGDATSDRAPLQVGQFESTAELMDQWLTWCFLEGGGGGSQEESYELGMYFLALHSEMDCWVKRKKRGYLFITGDEKPYPILSRHIVESVIGDRLDEDLRVEEVLAELQKTFVPFFVIPDEGRRTAQGAERAWRDLLGDHVICLNHPMDVCYATAGALLIHEEIVGDIEGLNEVLVGAGMALSRRGAIADALGPVLEAFKFSK